MVPTEVQSGTRTSRGVPVREANDIVRKRAVLATARTQFSSSLQPMKQISLDHIVGNILYSCAPDAWVSIDQVRNTFRKDSGNYSLNYNDAEGALRRLVANGDAERHPASFTRFKLSSNARKRIKQIEDDAEEHIERVLYLLFSSDPQGYRKYRNPFLDLISCVFGVLGEESARLITRMDGHENYFANISLEDIIKTRVDIGPNCDVHIFREGVTRFFEEHDPSYAELKWNLAQNLFVTRFLGMDPSGALLSRDVFGDAVFYLDTNVVVSALEPDDSGHGWFQSLIECARRLGSEVRVCAPTIGELSSFVEGQRADVILLSKNLPGPFQEVVDSIFVRKYRASVRRGEDPSVDSLFAHLSDARSNLKSQYGIEVEDDEWFQRASSDASLEGFARRLREIQISRGKEKKPGAARHDSIVLTWIEQKRRVNGSAIWFVTTDGSLPGAVPAESQSKSLAVLVTTLLQWITPIVGSAADSAEFAVAFSRMARERLLPRQQFMEARHFRVLAELGVDMNSMTAEEVERIYNDLRAQAPTLDVSQPADREKLSLIVHASLADADAKRQQDIARLEREKLAEQQERLRAEEESARRIKHLEDELEVERQKSETERREERERQAREQTEREAVERRRERQRQHQNDRKWGWVGIGATFAALAFCESLFILVASKYQNDSNLNFFEKLTASSELLLIPVVPVLLVGGWITGVHRLAAVGWPFSALFHVDPAEQND